MPQSFTLLIQGSITDLALQTIDANRKLFGLHVLLSNRFDATIDEELRRAADVVVYYPPTIPEGVHNYQHAHLHTASMEAAIDSLDTTFVIKVRGDEYFQDLSPLVEACKKNPDKFNSCDIFFRSCRQMPFHPSYHLFGMKTTSLIKMLGVIRSRLTTHYVYSPSGNQMCYEMLLGTSFLESQGILPNFKHPVPQMRERFSITPIAAMGNVKWTYSEHKPGEWDKGTRVYIDHPNVRNVLGLSISSMDDITIDTTENQTW
jgi:hypothetical protein